MSSFAEGLSRRAGRNSPESNLICGRIVSIIITLPWQGTDYRFFANGPGDSGAVCILCQKRISPYRLCFMATTNKRGMFWHRMPFADLNASKSLQEEFSALSRLRNSQKRGKRFELFLARLLERETLKVDRDPSTAKPRQTDLVAHDEHGFFLVEAKWTEKRTGIPDIVQIRDRLTRVPRDVFACVFSVSGFSDPAIKDICQRKDGEIHLFNRAELVGIIDGKIRFRELLRKKKEWLRTHGSLLLLDSVPSSDSPFQIRTKPDVLEVEGLRLHWLRNHTGHNNVIFSNEMLDFSHRQLHSTFSLHLATRTENLDDLRRLLNVLQNLLGFSGQGPFSISQGGEGWFGYGIDSFLSTAQEQDQRYKELNWQSYHHSEQMAYLDKPESGGLICVTSQQSTGTGKGYLHSTFLEMLLPGIPVDGSQIRELCKIAGDENAYLESVRKDRVFEFNFHPPIEVRPVGKIISNSNGRAFASGLVIENPFLHSENYAVNDDELQRFLSLIRKNPFLICVLRDWHNTKDLMDTYHLFSVEACWIEGFCAFHLVCTWD